MFTAYGRRSGGRSQPLGRSLDYASFYFAAGWRLWRLACAGDVIVVKTDPPLLSVIAALIAKLREARLVNWLQDHFPEAAGALNVEGSLGSVAFSLMRRLRNWSLHCASINVVVGEGMAARSTVEGISRERIRVIPNWSDRALIKPIPMAENGFANAGRSTVDLVVGYAGNLGRAHEVATIIDDLVARASPPLVRR
jgi:colanic acid biosynthesis glycosyl transferase WcaI